MSDTASTVSFLEDLGQAAKARHQIATHLGNIATTLESAESEAEQGSGKLGLARDIETVRLASHTIRQGVFRLLVLGDMKRGKSTLVNALLGDPLLPSDVNPCTALLTVLKYGPEKQITLHFNDGKSPKQIDVQTFKAQYTIDPDAAKVLEQQQQQAFPDISHAVVEYPLPLLEQGIELVDTPGLNDTEARNQQVFDYLNTCHAVLFVLSATQPCTIDERRYLQNYLKDRGLTLFFLINWWDQVQSGLVNPEDRNALVQAETNVRQVFQTHLSEYCQVDGQDRYAQRVFEVSALQALRSRLKDPTSSLEGTGVSEFLAALSQFLTRDRVQVEFKTAAHRARRTYHRVSEAIERRVPLLGQDASELKDKIASMQSEFDKLAEIRDQFQQLIRTTRDREAHAMADHFKAYILNLEQTFEADFLASQPDLEFLDFLEKNNRAMFYTSFKRAFERYMNDRLAAWEFIAKQQVGKTFEQLNEAAADYRVAYAQVVEVMNEKLLGSRFYAAGHTYNPEQTATWTDTIKDVFEAIPDNLNQSVGQFNLFWQRVMQSALAYVCIVIALQILSLIFSSLALNVFAAVLAGTGVVALQAEYVRQEFLAKTRKEFAKYLPQIAEEQQTPISQAVKKCFDSYEGEVIEQINADIGSRQAELTNLLQQKQTREIHQETESQRLKALESDIANQLQQIEALISP